MSLLIVFIICICFITQNPCVDACQIHFDKFQLDHDSSLQSQAIELYNHGVVLQFQSEIPDIKCAIEFYSRALKLNVFPEVLQNIAMAHEAMGNYVLADHYYANCAQISTSQVRANCAANLINLRLNMHSIVGIDEFELLNNLAIIALEDAPDNTHCLYALASMIVEYEGFSRSLAYFNRILEIDPRHSMTLLNIGNEYFRHSIFPEAVIYYERAISAISENDIAARIMVVNNLGQAHREQGHVWRALQCLYRAITWLQVLPAAGDPKDPLQTIVATHSSQISEYLTLNTAAAGGRSHILLVSELFNAALFRVPPRMRALVLWTGNNALAIHGLSCNWRHLEQLELFMTQALQQFGFFKEHPQLGVDNVLIDPYTFSLMRYASLEEDVAVCAKACPATFTDYDGDDDKDEGNVSSAHTAMNDSGDGDDVAESVQPEIRIAYLSYDWRDHPMGRLTQFLVTRQQRHRAVETLPLHSQHLASASPKLTVYCVSYGPHDNSSIRKAVQRDCDHFVDLHHIHSKQQVQHALRALNLDVIVDLTAHTYNGRVDYVAEVKPAPVVINYLGFPGSTGCVGYDYAILDHLVAPPEHVHKSFSERVMYLPHSYQVNHMPLHLAPCEGRGAACRGRLMSAASLTLHMPIPLEPVSSSGDEGEGGGDGSRGVIVGQRMSLFLAGRQHGDSSDDWSSAMAPSSTSQHYSQSLLSRLTDQSSVWLCAFNAKQKMEPVVISLWFNIMRARPRSLLLYLGLDPDTKQHLLLHAAYHGISPMRLVFLNKLSWEVHLLRSASCDVMLDTLVYGAHTTATDMLWMSVPLMTLTSWGTGRLPSRVAAAIVSFTGRQGRHHLHEDNHSSSSAISGGGSEEWMSRISVSQSLRTYEHSCVRLIRAERPIVTLHRWTARSQLQGGSFSPATSSRSVERCFALAMNTRRLTRLRLGSSALPRGKAFHIIVGEALAAQSGQSAVVGYVSEQLSAVAANDDQNMSESAPVMRAIATRLAAGGQLKSVAEALQLSGHPVIAEVMNVASINTTTEREQTQLDCSALLQDLTVLTRCRPGGLSRGRCDQEVLLYHEYLKNIIVNHLQLCFSANQSQDTLDLLRQASDQQQRLLSEFGCEYEKYYYSMLSDLIFKVKDGWQWLAKWQAKSRQYLYSLGCSDDCIRAHVEAEQHTQFVFSNFMPNIAHIRDLSTIGISDKLQKLLHDSMTSRSFAHRGNAHHKNPCQDQLQANSELSKILFHHSLCLKDDDLARIQPNLPESAVSFSFLSCVLSAYALEPTVDRLLTLGLSLQDVGLRRAGQVLTDEAVLVQQNMASKLLLSSLSSPMATSALLESAAEKQPEEKQQEEEKEFVGVTVNSSVNHHNKLSRVIHIYCNQYGREWWPQWGPSSAVTLAQLRGSREVMTAVATDPLSESGERVTGLGGAEEAVLYLGVTLAALGHSVVVYANVASAEDLLVLEELVNITRLQLPPSSAAAMGHITWLPHEAFSQRSVEGQVFISWRYAHSLSLARLASVRMLWLHDLVPLRKFPTAVFSRQVDHILVQSDFHAEHVMREMAQDDEDEHPPSLNPQSLYPPLHTLRVVPNGVSALFHTDGPNHNHVFIYASSPSRGLQEVLLVWPDIRQKLPHAMLHIYYGFTEAVKKQLAVTMGRDVYEQWQAEMTVLLAQAGVFMLGAQDHFHLAAGMAHSGFLLYPTSFPETGCITVQRAMVSGSVPITSLLTHSVLPSLTAGYDLGPVEHPLNESTAADTQLTRLWLRQHWLPAVLHVIVACSTTEGEQVMAARRADMKTQARAHFSWTRSAQRLIEHALQ